MFGDEIVQIYKTNKLAILLEDIRLRCPVVDRALHAKGDLTLNQYTQSIKIQDAKPLQEKRDFLMLVEEYCEPLLGKQAAKEIATTLEFPLLATANHHGVDFSPQTMQGNWIYWKILLGKGIDLKYLPICAFGMVSLRNSSYARGLMIHTLGKGRIRLPIFSKTMENTTVRHTKAFSKQQVERALKEMRKKYNDLSSAETVVDILENVYLDKEILACDRYGDQALLLNRRLAQRSFQENEFPELIYLEIEQITNKLFATDLGNDHSLLYLLLCDKKMLKLLNKTHCGSVPLTRRFFWGMDEEGRRYPVQLTEDGQIVGRTLKGTDVRMNGERGNLIRLVQEEKIVPAGYSIAAMLCWARGYTWMGGCFQGEYLPIWQNLTSECLAEAGYEAESQSVAQYDCAGYMCGPIFALSETDDHVLNPAGLVELIQRGGISRTQMEGFMEVTVREAHEMGLMEFYEDLTVAKERQDGWSWAIAKGLKEKYGKYAIPQKSGEA